MPLTPRLVKSIDVRGKLCPLPVFETSKAVAILSKGDVLEVLATDVGSKPDLLAWAKRTGNVILEVTEAGGVFRFLIQKGV